MKKVIEMKLKLAVLTMAYALFSIGSVAAADKTEPNQVVGFGSGTGMGAGGGVGSTTSVVSGFSALGGGGGSGGGSQSFGGGFSSQASTGAGPLSSNPNSNSAFGPILTSPY